MLTLVSWAIADQPPELLRRPDSEFKETPPRKFIENLPPADDLPEAQVPPPQKRAYQAMADPGPAWTALGPFPIPNGQTENRVDPVSGRVTAIAVHPTNPDIAYVGTAQGGLYRTLDGGASWRQMMDAATPGPAGTPLAIGAVTIDPTDANNVLVGTGEGNFSSDSFFGCGLYIITQAQSDAPRVHGPFNERAGDRADIFTGRSFTAIVVDPNDHNNIFCSTVGGVGGIVPSFYPVLPPRGLYRSTNAFAGIDSPNRPSFTRVRIAASDDNSAVTDVAMEPGNPNTLVVALYAQDRASTGGVYRTTNALSPSPFFSRSLATDDEINIKLAITSAAAGVTVYALTEEGDPQGRLYKSVDGGASFGGPLTAADGIAGQQGFYDLAVAVDPFDPNIVYVGGSVDNGIFMASKDGGATFQPSITGLHVDTHAIAVSPSNPAVIYHGNDGGVWRSTNGGASWVSRNTSTFSATQFSGLALHPTDRNFSLGGTQDNGTELLMPDGSFRRADFGDGGYTLIDQNATDTINVAMYHTYFNATGLILGTARVLNANCAFDGNWSFHGAFVGPRFGPYCDGSFDTRNRIGLFDEVNFYAPQVLGPGNPNSWYFGSERLYRSADRADTVNAVSQRFDSGVPISAIAISPQTDSVRVVGLNNGKVFATTTGATAMRQIAGEGATSGTAATPKAAVGRIAIDPNNPLIAYLCFTGYGAPGKPMAHVWKTMDLEASPVVFQPISDGLPDVPVNAIAIDPAVFANGSSLDIYVGTDIGVYYSPDGGASWSQYGTGFPRVAVFGLEIQSSWRIIRAATHGRGLYETSTVASTVLPPEPQGNDQSTKLVNLSTRGIVRSGDGVMIAGVIVTGDSQKKVALRAAGPSLAPFGLSNAITDPTITLRDAD